MQNKTLAPVQWQVPVLAVRAMRSGSTSRDCAAFGACGVPGQPLWRRGGNTQSRALNKRLESGAFKHKLTSAEEKHFCLHRVEWNRELHRQQQELEQLHWEGKASAELLPRAVFHLGSQGTTARLGFASCPWGATCTQGCWHGTRGCAQSGTRMRHWLRNSNITTLVIQGFIKSYMQNILPIALAKDQCKNFTILQLLFWNFALVVEKV